ncbi:hypothetical protein C9383_03160 [Pseudomonas palleroniana]|uniref:Uncharacterized protein n=1 Tax=Pseudomonas palleroniana TaxID=191390 RepID=A0A1H5N6E6_9PSED|nr:hypothetical protein [Pseudomonas palleroniana]KAB0569719.1 hypothetical protein F7R03_00885 [Pseudomonas palleroniana]PTC31241.1 hypothetical protein C9383_03160 [Pseudomonas palleroniana]SEE97199.1 hypothetical protein SAMN04490198_3941 [Pseudomonas palleroniana]
MASVYLTGIAVRQAGLDLADIARQEAAFVTAEAASKGVAVLSAQMAKDIAREDRAILSDAAIRSLTVADAACAMAQQQLAFSEEARALINVYTTAETVRDFYEILYEYRIKHPELTAADLHAVLGRVAGSVHPLRLFRKLPTNNLYHIAKFFGFIGGGYPLRSMSLGGLSLLEHALFKLEDEAQGGALLCGVGDMIKADNFEAFRKMGLIESDPHRPQTDKVNVTHGAVALMLENAALLQRSGHVALAQIVSVHSRFDGKIHSQQADWEALLSGLPAAVIGEKPVVVMYDNGAPNLRQVENAAVFKALPNVDIRRYKPYTGYAGSTSGLVDLACALADKSVEVGRTLLVNGMGIGIGCACAVVKKLQHLPIDRPVLGEAS